MRAMCICMYIHIYIYMNNKYIYIYISHIINSAYLKYLDYYIKKLKTEFWDINWHIK